MIEFEVVNGDCVEILKDIDANSIDAFVTDPPYELGFMGKKWDATGIAYNVELWHHVLRVLKPGGHLLAFGGTRTYHRMACAIEDAGFEIRDCLQWLYGSGFPKSLDVSKAIDACASAERPVIGPAAAWDGWGTALKPANEPIVLARKPLIGTVASNVLTHGTGAINVNGCRIGWVNEADAAAAAAVGFEKSRSNNTVVQSASMSKESRDGSEHYDPEKLSGRWPANVILDEEAAAVLDEQSGVLKSGSHTSGAHMGYSGADGYLTSKRTSSVGGASRFFYCAKTSASEREAGLDHLPVKSAGELTDRKDGSDGLNSPRSGAGRGGGRRNHHPTVKPISLMRYLCRLITPLGGVIIDPFCGSGSTGCAAMLEGFNFIGIERESEYVEIARARISERLRRAA